MEGFDLRNLLNPECWLAMDSDGGWFLYNNKPSRSGWHWSVRGGKCKQLESDFFNIQECENWEDSLIQVKDLIKD